MKKIVIERKYVDILYDVLIQKYSDEISTQINRRKEIKQEKFNFTRI